MTDEIVVPAPGLTQIERVVDTFVAPAATFTDILRSSAWWLPFILGLVASFAFAWTIDHKVGFAQVAETQMHLNPSQEERLNSLTPEDRATQMHSMIVGYRYTSYAFPILGLVISAVASLILWVSFNFGLGARTTYGQIFCLWQFANLPRLLTTLVTLATLWFGGSPETFDLKEPAGTNIAYYLPDAGATLKSFLSFFDIVGIWVLVLLILGGAIIAKVKTGQAAAVVIGWWLLVLIASVAATAAFS